VIDCETLPDGVDSDLTERGSNPSAVLGFSCFGSLLKELRIAEWKGGSSNRTHGSHR
jgi:hypothetical protein